RSDAAERTARTTSAPGRPHRHDYPASGTPGRRRFSDAAGPALRRPTRRRPHSGPIVGSPTPPSRPPLPPTLSETRHFGKGDKENQEKCGTTLADPIPVVH